MYDGQAISIDALLNMIVDNSSITKLSVMAVFPWNRAPSKIVLVELGRFAREHPQLVELVLRSYWLTPDDAIDFFRSFKSLEKFRFLTPETEYMESVSQLENAGKIVAKYLILLKNIKYRDVTLDRQIRIVWQKKSMQIHVRINYHSIYMGIKT